MCVMLLRFLTDEGCDFTIMRALRAEGMMSWRSAK